MEVRSASRLLIFSNVSLHILVYLMLILLLFYITLYNFYVFSKTVICYYYVLLDSNSTSRKKRYVQNRKVQSASYLYLYLILICTHIFMFSVTKAILKILCSYCFPHLSEHGVSSSLLACTLLQPIDIFIFLLKLFLLFLTAIGNLTIKLDAMHEHPMPNDHDNKRQLTIPPIILILE